MTESLKEIINQYVSLQPENHKGWQAVQCSVCNDHTRKGLRGAFLFDGDKVIYKCWNCGHTAVYDPLENELMPKNMVRVLDDFGIPDDIWKSLILSSPAYMNGAIKRGTDEAPSEESIEPKELKMPDFFYYLKDAAADDEIAAEARIYLKEVRQVDPDAFPYMLAHKHTNRRLHKWLGRVIMPIYKNNKLIYYIGRALYDAPQKYETPASPKEKVLYGFERLFERTTAPLFIVEGWFDAYAIDGVATLGNVITPYQAQWLDRSKREKIYIPDKFGDGFRAAEQALKNGWKISTPDIGSDCKDMDDAVKKYGKLYVIRSIIENSADGFGALVRLKDYCES